MKFSEGFNISYAKAMARCRSRYAQGMKDSKRFRSDSKILEALFKLVAKMYDASFSIYRDSFSFLSPAQFGIIITPPENTSYKDWMLFVQEKVEPFLKKHLSWRETENTIEESVDSVRLKLQYSIKSTYFIELFFMVPENENAACRIVKSEVPVVYSKVKYNIVCD